MAAPGDSDKHIITENDTLNWKNEKFLYNHCFSFHIIA